MSHWRDIAKPIISEVIRKTGREDAKKLKKALKDAYPFGDRKNFPYKVWLDEIKKQVGKKHDTSIQKDMFI